MDRKTIVKIYLTFWIFVTSALLLATVYQSVSLNRDMARLILSIKIKIPSIAGIGGLAQIMMMLIVRKLKRLLPEIRRQSKAEKEMILKVHKQIRALGRVFIIVNSIGFFLGPGISFIIFTLTGRHYPPFEMFFIIVSHVLIGTVCSLLQLSSLQIIFREILDSFRMHRSIAEMRTMPVFRKRLLSNMSMFVLLSILLAGHLYGILFQIGSGNLDPAAALPSLIWGMLIVSGVIITILISVQFVLSKEEEAKLKQLQDKMEANLSRDAKSFRQIRIIAHDEYGRLASSVNRYTSRLSRLIEEISAAGRTVSETSGDLTAAIERSEKSLISMQNTNREIQQEISSEQEAVKAASLALETLDGSIRSVGEAVIEQAGLVEESSASITQMSANIRSVGDITVKATQETENLNQLIRGGSERLTETISSISNLRDSSEKVQTIIKVIQGISAQTNMLAMNAAIEAAHAGEAGAGFSVVANEVRKLAEESARSAQDIKDIISEMAEAISSGVSSTENTDEAFKAITAAVDNTSRIINTVKASMEEQQIGTSEISQAMSSLVGVSDDLKNVVEIQKSKNDEMNASFSQLRSSMDALESKSEAQQEEDRSLGETISGLQQVSDRNGEAVGRLEEAVNAQSAD